MLVMTRVDSSQSLSEEPPIVLCSLMSESIITLSCFSDQIIVKPLFRIEKTCKEFKTLFLQVLDEGRLTDGQGRLVDFR